MLPATSRLARTLREAKRQTSPPPTTVGLSVSLGGRNQFDGQLPRTYLRLAKTRSGISKSSAHIKTGCGGHTVQRREADARAANTADGRPDDLQPNISYSIEPLNFLVSVGASPVT